MKRVQIWQPDHGAPSGPQRRLLDVAQLGNVTEVLSAGEVGSGKTDAALMAPVLYPEYRTHPRFRGLVLRHSDGNKVKTDSAFSDFFQRIEEPGRWRRYVGGRLNRSDGLYKYRSHGEVLFTSTRSVHSLHGPEFQFVLFDELTHWPTPADYLYVCFTRARSSHGLPIRLRPTTNPGGPGHAWVRQRWGPWLASDYLARNQEGVDIHPGAASLRALGYRERFAADGRRMPPCENGEVLTFVINEALEEEWVATGTPGALTRSCLRTRTTDNVAMMANDPTYRMRTRAAGAVLHAQLGQDDWDLKAGGGKIFQREWFPILPAAPPLTMACRRWDFAWTKKKASKWSAGVKLGVTSDGRWPVLHVVRIKGTPREVMALVRQTAELDGREVPVVVPVDYSAGIVVVDDVIRELAGYQVLAAREKGDKDVRIATLEAPAAAGRIPLVAGGWTQAFLDEAHDYEPGGTGFNDQLDALAGAYLWAVDRGHVSLEQVGAALAHTAEVAAIGASRYRGDDDEDDDDGGGGGLGGFRVAV